MPARNIHKSSLEEKKIKHVNTCLKVTTQKSAKETDFAKQIPKTNSHGTGGRKAASASTNIRMSG